jgi:hypothetical protein
MDEVDDLSLADLDDVVWPEEGNPIPSDAKGLSDAFHTVLYAVVPEWPDLYDEVEHIEEKTSYHAFETGREPDLSDYKFALECVARALCRANQFFREKLAAEEVIAFVQHPDTREQMPLRGPGWQAAEPSMLRGMLDDHGGTGDNPAHPDATIAGQKCSVFFQTDDFDKWLKSTFGGARGRPFGSGWLSSDQPLLREMARLIATGKASSPYNAAHQVASKAAGGGTLESRVRRLERRYSTSNKSGQRPRRSKRPGYPDRQS